MKKRPPRPPLRLVEPEATSAPSPDGSFWTGELPDGRWVAGTTLSGQDYTSEPFETEAEAEAELEAGIARLAAYLKKRGKGGR